MRTWKHCYFINFLKWRLRPRFPRTRGGSPFVSRMRRHRPPRVTEEKAGVGCYFLGPKFAYNLYFLRLAYSRFNHSVSRRLKEENGGIKKDLKPWFTIGSALTNVASSPFYNLIFCPLMISFVFDFCLPPSTQSRYYSFMLPSSKALTFENSLIFRQFSHPPFDAIFGFLLTFFASSKCLPILPLSFMFS